MKHFRTNKQLLNNDEINKAALEYCIDLLNNRDPNDKYRKDIAFLNNIHEVRMKEENNENEEITIKMFDDSLNDLKKKKKDKYAFILKSGNAYKQALFQLFKMVWNQERKPEQWRLDNIIQLYKGKGPKDQFENLRNIHTKNYVPKLFENIIFNMAKPKIVSGTSKFQIGAINAFA